MRKSEKVRQIYAELKAVYGDEMSSREILECASLVVKATEESLYEPAMDSLTGRIPFTELPVHVIFEDWSWKVLSREMLWEDDFNPHTPTQLLIEQCLLLAA